MSMRCQCQVLNLVSLYVIIQHFGTIYYTQKCQNQLKQLRQQASNEEYSKGL